MDEDARKGANPKAAFRTRYRTRSFEGRSLVFCANSPQIALSFEEGRSVGATARKRFPERSVFLDGFCSSSPFIDNARRHYNLDHHALCVRPFTLAACEQAAVLVHEGLPLGEGEWTLYANSLDLDALLAAWVLMNHAELSVGGEGLLRSAMPLIRAEGLIDAHGLDSEPLSGMEAGAFAARKAQLAALLDLLAEARAEPGARDADLVPRFLSELDALLLPPDLVRELGDCEEAGRVPLRDGKLALLFRSAKGIYELESFVSPRYGAGLGIIVLEAEPRRYTLRLADQFLRQDLTPLYRRLNRIDGAASRERTAERLWGGSASIGGSPREGGSDLSGEEILAAIEGIYGRRKGFLAKLSEGFF